MALGNIEEHMEEFDIELLKDYLNNRLSKEEKDSIERKLESDPEFKEQFRINKSLLEGIEFHFDKQLKQSFKDREIKLKKRRLSLVMSVAASFLIIAMLSYWMWDINSGHSDVYLKYYKPYYNVVDEPKRDSVLLPDDASAFQLYDKGEYSEAIGGLRNALVSNPNNAQASFYLGLSYLALNQPDSAVRYLDKSYQGESSLSEPAQWYLGLAYLKSGRTEDAKKVFKEIYNTSGGYRDRAESILEDLQ